MDLLDAAYDLLRTANRPLTAKEMVDSILKNGQWKTNGKVARGTDPSGGLGVVEFGLLNAV